MRCHIQVFAEGSIRLEAGRYLFPEFAEQLLGQVLGIMGFGAPAKEPDEKFALVADREQLLERFRLQLHAIHYKEDKTLIRNLAKHFLHRKCTEIEPGQQ